MIRASVLAILFLAQAPSGATLPSARAVLTAIDKDGASVVLKRMYEDDGRWLLLMKSIASGRADWLSVGVRLRAVSDAGASEEIESAFSRALVVAPERVLPLLASDDNGGPNLLAVCSGVMLAEDQNEKDMRAWAKETEKVLRTTRPGTEAGRQNRTMCLDTLLTEFPKLNWR